MLERGWLSEMNMGCVTRIAGHSNDIDDEYLEDVKKSLIKTCKDKFGEIDNIEFIIKEWQEYKGELYDPDLDDPETKPVTTVGIKFETKDFVPTPISQIRREVL